MLLHLINEFTAYAAMISHLLQSDRVPALHSLPYPLIGTCKASYSLRAHAKILQFALFADIKVVLDLITQKMSRTLEAKVAFFGVCYVI